MEICNILLLIWTVIGCVICVWFIIELAQYIVETCKQWKEEDNENKQS